MSENGCGGGRRKERRLPVLNFRPLLFCAVGLCSGIFIYVRVRYGGLTFSDFLFSGTLILVAAFPLSLRRALALGLCVALFAGLGALSVHLYAERYASGAEEGRYEVEGVVSSFAVHRGWADVTLKEVVLNGVSVGGKLSVTVDSEQVRAGDRLYFSANVKRNGFLRGEGAYAFTQDVRYTAGSVSAVRGESGDPFLRTQAALYDTLHENMEQEEADLVFALLTGESGSMDEGVLTVVREGGIAHMFAVSGLHIGILYAAVRLLFRPLRRYASLPAIAAAVLYAAFCGFAVSALRAVIMCGVHAAYGLLRRKADFLNELSFAAILILLLFPAEWLSAGFRLSFGACLGLALFSGALSRGMRRLRLPRFFASCLSSSVSVQIFVFPVLMESFGYVSVWGTLLNLVLIPMLPAFFLAAFLSSALALAVPPAAAVLLAVPEGLSAALLFVLANVDVSLVVTGFSLGAGGTVWLTACVALSERVRLSRAVRVGALGIFSLLFACCLFVRNAVTVGCKISVSESAEGLVALVRTPQCSVLVTDGSVSLGECEKFLARNLPHAPDYAVVISSDEAQAVNIAAFTGAGTVYVMAEAPFGMNASHIVASERAELSGMVFRYESAHKVVLFAEDTVVEFDFEHRAVLCADFSVEKGAGDLNFFLRHGIIGTL